MVDTKATWDRVDKALAGNQLELSHWDANACFESGCAASSRSAPLCVLCFQPAMPMALAADLSADPAAASTLWKRGSWHVQCANFWIRHGATSKLMQQRGLSDPSGQ